MKIAELKLGDWVYAKNPITCEDMPCKIEKINDDKVLAGLIWCHFDELSPIPLTEEILEKNGWKKGMDGTQCYYFEKYCIRKAYPKEEKWMLFLVDLFVTSFKHTHELQHILWALGIKDNLKI